MTKKIPDPVRAYLAAIGKKGGSVSSPAKQEAARANIKKRWANRAADQGAKDKTPRKKKARS